MSRFLNHSIPVTIISYLNKFSSISSIFSVPKIISVSILVKSCISLT